jgi:hypothetical protein
LGEWYGSRKTLFTDATPIKYEGNKAPGVDIDNERFFTIASKLGDDTLLHIIDMDGQRTPLSLELDLDEYSGPKSVFLEPNHRELALFRA